MRQTGTSIQAGMAAALIGMALAGGMTAGNGSVRTVSAQESTNATQQQPAKPVRASTSFASVMHRVMGGYGSGSRGWQRARGPGWTNAHARRVARKARSVRAHRARSRA